MTPGSGPSLNPVQDYIDALLCEPVLDEIASSERDAADAPAPPELHVAGIADRPDTAPVSELPAVTTRTGTGDAAKAGDRPEAAVDDNPFLAQLARRQQGATSDEDSLRPLWAQERFSCQGFNVGGLKLAIPTEYIAGMQPLELVPSASNDPGPAVGAASNGTTLAMHYLGQQRVLDEQGGGGLVDVLDTARLVMPERYGQAMTEAYRYVLTLRDSDWCIAVDSIAGELNFDAGRVRWRSAHTRREWLAGTVVDKMCALVDIDALNRHRLADRVMGDDEGGGE